jgi:hypothetical protein
VSLMSTLDRFVRRTHLYDTTMIERPEPRNLRWTPIAVLAALLAGYTLLCIAAPRPNTIILGLLFFILGWLGSFYLRFYGPRMVDDPRQPLDERERDLRARAGRLAGNVTISLIMAFCLYMGGAPVFDAWRPQRAGDWTMLALALQAAHMTLPVLFASWLERPLAGGD